MNHSSCFFSEFKFSKNYLTLLSFWDFLDMMAIIFMMKIGNNNRNPSIHRKNVCVGITVLYMYKNVSSRPSYFVNERRCKGLLKKKEHHEYHYEYINLHIASFSVWLGSYAHKIAQRHIWQRSRHGFGFIKLKTEQTRRVIFLRKIIFLCLFSCVHFFIKHTMVS